MAVLLKISLINCQQLSRFARIMLFVFIKMMSVVEIRSGEHHHCLICLNYHKDGEIEDKAEHCIVVWILLLIFLLLGLVEVFRDQSRGSKL